MLQSLQLNNYSWQVHPLAEDALLLKFEGERNRALDEVHTLFRTESLHSNSRILDIVAGYDSLALYFDVAEISAQELIQEIQNIDLKPSEKEETKEYLEVPVCYELGTDWEEVERQSGLKRPEIIELHLNADYRVAFVGFMPGFVYLDGLDERLICKRKNEPDIRVPEGAVGIGGMFTGIYSRPSPGGWQIIGRTPFDLFDEHSMPPLKVKAGSKIRFNRVTEQDFAKIKESGDED